MFSIKKNLPIIINDCLVANSLVIVTEQKWFSFPTLDIDFKGCTIEHLSDLKVILLYPPNFSLTKDQKNDLLTKIESHSHFTK